MAGVDLEGVSRVYPGGVVAVDNLSLSVRDQEFVVLVGPSGCGKSSTLRLIAGLEEATTGTIRIGNRVVNRVAPKDRDVAMVFQNYALYPHMSVYKNMAFGLRLRYGAGPLARLWRRIRDPEGAREMARRRQEIPQRVGAAAASLGIERLLERYPAQLSGGERQRVALGRAIVRQPAVFLFDEPLSNLDARLRLEMRRELKQLHKRLATTMVYVTHDQSEAMTLGERIVVLDRGAVQQIGPPLDVYRRPANRFVASFLGTPPMNLWSGRLNQRDDGWRFEANGWSILLGGDVSAVAAVADRPTLGVRPEDLKVSPVEALSVDASADALAVDAQAVNRPGCIAARIEMVETLGDSLVAYAAPIGPNGRPAADRLVSRVVGVERLEADQAVAVQFNFARLHWFDAAGKRIDLETPTST